MRIRWFVLPLLLAVMAQVAPSQQGKLRAGQVRVNTKDGLKYVWIPPGTFMMGCSPGDNECRENEKPAHPVSITKGFWIGLAPVTVRGYERFATAAKRPMPRPLDARMSFDWTHDRLPMTWVTWDDAQAYCTWGGGRLPTEAEWEYAARGGSTGAHYGPLDEIAWYADNSGARRIDSTRLCGEHPHFCLGYLSQNSTALHEAGLKRPNGFGLLDTLGDVVEWVNDWFDEHYYQSSPAQDPQGPSSGKVRVQRGGSYLDLPAGVRVSARSAWNPTVRFATNGFRCSAGEKDLIEAVAATPRQQPSVEAKVQNAPPPGQVQVNPKDGAKYVWISPGTFMMGCSPGDSECGAQEMPAHQVTISGGFWMGQTLVTAEAYQRFAGATGRKMPKAPHFNQNWTDGQMPIVNANWDDAHDYCAWAGGRLPTEAEWEYAARGGSTEARTGPIDEIAWYNQNSEKQPHDVARKRANGFGLFDMLGNVWEWVNDWYDASYYLYTPAQDPPGAEQNPGVRGATFQPWARSLRGGSWQQHALWIRVSARDSFTPAHGYDNIGFRCAREVVSP